MQGIFPLKEIFYMGLSGTYTYPIYNDMPKCEQQHVLNNMYKNCRGL